MKKTYVLLAGIAIVVCIAIVYAVVSRSASDTPQQIPVGETHSIVLHDAGYEPREITINQGDVIEFSSQRGFPHWPASDLHPTHNMYASFDPKAPVDANETWSFQFTKVGTWDFHDHLNSTFGGTITVLETPSPAI